MSCALSRGSRASLARGIGRALVLAWALFFVLCLIALPDRFGEMFRALEVPIPPLTRFFLDIGGAGVASLYGVLTVLFVGALLVARRPWLKVAVLVGAAVATEVLTDLFASAMVEPLRSLFEH
ncbi:MAG: hypothetical protein ACREIU_10205 [Planctomycetota bacterium]